MVADNRVFVDISSLLRYCKNVDRYSGIQRVLTQLLIEIQRINKEQIFYLSYQLDDELGKFYTLRLEELGADTLSCPIKMREFFFGGVGVNSKSEALRRYKDRKLKYTYHKIRLDVASMLDIDRPFTRYGIRSSDWRNWEGKRTESIKESKKSHLLRDIAQKGDTLLLLDSSWTDSEYIFNEAKSIGLHVGILIYDLIPILMPHVVHVQNVMMFEAFLFHSMEVVSFYMTISESAKRDLLEFLKDNGKDFPVTALPLTQTGLGGMVDGSPPELRRTHRKLSDAKRLLTIGESMRSVFNAPFALCVGTIEPRKNGLRLALAWKLMLDKGRYDIPRLVFAGRRGWYVDELFGLLQATGNLYGYVSVIEGPTDDELDFLYRKCEFALMPSLYEGWGLPVGEALSYGKTAVVAEGSSLPEVGQDLVVYCDPKSVASISQAVLKLDQNRELRRDLEERIRSAPLRTWNDVASDLLEIVHAKTAGS